MCTRASRSSRRGARAARAPSSSASRSRGRDRRARRRPARADVRDRAGARPRLRRQRRRPNAARVPADRRLLRRALALPNEPRAATVQAVSDCALLRFSPELFRRLLAEHPDFRHRLEQRLQQYDYRRVANVPLDFAEELLPAEAFSRQISAEQVELEPDAEPLGEPEAVKQRPIRRFPHVYQLDEMDCGAACLAMICLSLRPRGRVSHIREAVHTSTDGTTPRGHHARCGRARAHRPVGEGVEEPARRACRCRPSFIGRATIGSSPTASMTRYVRVSDPARGLRTHSTRRVPGEVERLHVGRRLHRPPRRCPEARTSLSWVKPFLRPHLRLVLFAVGLAVVAATLELTLPILTQVVVDHVLPHKNLHLLWLLMLAIVGVLVAITGATLVQRYLLSKVAVRFDVATLDFLTGRLLDLPMSYFATRRTGDIERRLLGARQVRAFFIQSGVQALTSATQLIAALGLMFFYSWLLALVYLATVPAYAALMLYSAKRLRADVRQSRRGIRALLVRPDRRDSRHRDREGACGGRSTPPADAQPLPVARRPRLPHGVPRARISGLVAARLVRDLRSLPSRRVDRGRARRPFARRVRRVQRARRARNRSGAALLSLWDQGQYARCSSAGSTTCSTRSRNRASTATACAR